MTNHSHPRFLDVIIGGGASDPTTPTAAMITVVAETVMLLPHETLHRLRLQLAMSNSSSVVGAVRRLMMQCSANGMGGQLLVVPSEGLDINAVGICTGRDKQAVSNMLQKLPGVSLLVGSDAIQAIEARELLSAPLAVWLQIQLELSGAFRPMANLLLDVQSLPGAAPGEEVFRKHSH